MTTKQSKTVGRRAGARTATIVRNTTETRIELELAIEGQGQYKLDARFCRLSHDGCGTRALHVLRLLCCHRFWPRHHPASVFFQRCRSELHLFARPMVIERSGTRIAGAVAHAARRDQTDRLGVARANFD